MNILGISAFYHDSAAALVCDGQIVAAAQEERFTRKKHDPDFPVNSVRFCLEESGLSLADIDFVVFYEKPFLKFERLMETYLAFAPRGFASFRKAIPVWVKEKIFQRRQILEGLKEVGEEKFKGHIAYTQHHESHAASAFFPSPFDEAAIVCADGVGEWTTTSIYHGKGNEIEPVKEQRFPHSLGLLYSAFTYYCGFRVNSGEYKLMGLAPYGEPKYEELIREKLLVIREDGSFRLNMEYFNYCTGLTMTSRKFHELFGAEPRKPESELTQFHMDLAASIQRVTEDIMLKVVSHAKKVTGSSNLCLAGGVALNCVSNGKLLKNAGFDEIWIQPAAGDAGGALGAALITWYQLLDNERGKVEIDRQHGTYLGPEFDENEIESFLQGIEASYKKAEDDEALCSEVGKLLSEENVVGWFQGKMEFGPRALGNRSILGDPRSAEMQKVINLKIKFRESFRPFAPSVLKGEVANYFEMKEEQDSPYMLLVAGVAESKRRGNPEALDEVSGIEKLPVERSTIQAVTHVDYSARVQTVDKNRNPRYHRLIEEFQKHSGIPVIVNTSFNVRGEPIVCTPEDAYRCFMSTNMDVLVLGSYILRKEDQPEALVIDPEEHLGQFAID